MAAATRDSGSKRPPRALNGSRVITPEIVVMIDKKAELAWLASLEQPPDFPDLIPMIDCGVSSMRAYPVHAMTPTGASSAQEATLQAASPVWDRLSKRRQSTGNTPSHHNGWLDRLDELSSMLKDVSAQHPGPLRRQHLESCVIVEPSSSATTDAPTTYEGVQDQRKGANANCIRCFCPAFPCR